MYELEGLYDPKEGKCDLIDLDMFQQLMGESKVAKLEFVANGFLLL